MRRIRPSKRADIYHMVRNGALFNVRRMLTVLQDIWLKARTRYIPKLRQVTHNGWLPLVASHRVRI